MTSTPAVDTAPVGTPVISTRRSGRVVAALARRDLSGRRVVGTALLLDFLFGLTNLAVFALISRFLHHPQQAGLGAATSYFDYVAVGIVFMLVVQAACLQVTKRVQDEQRSGTLELQVAEPGGTAGLGIGLALYPMASAVLRAIVYVVLAGALLGLDVHRTSWPGVAVVLLLGGVATMAVGVSLAAYAVAFAHGPSASRLVVVALSFASGTYFPVESLSPTAGTLSQVLPTRMALDGLRAALTGQSWATEALLLTGAAVVAVPLSAWLFGLAVRRAVRQGTLTRG